MRINTKQNTELFELTQDMTGEIVGLIAEAMNAEEGAWAGVTIGRHFEMRAAGLSDGRHYFALRLDGALAGITGLHHYEWGPDENVWLGWFAVSPKLHRQGIGALLMRETEKTAKSLGYRKLFIETYDSPTFSKAIRFYLKAGFRKAGKIGNYLPDGSSMLVFLKEL
jgi:GNAT superfamily N-acetyltransferase